MFLILLQNCKKKFLRRCNFPHFITKFLRSHSVWLCHNQSLSASAFHLASFIYRPWLPCMRHIQLSRSLKLLHKIADLMQSLQPLWHCTCSFSCSSELVTWLLLGQAALPCPTSTRMKKRAKPSECPLFGPLPLRSHLASFTKIHAMNCISVSRLTAHAHESTHTRHFFVSMSLGYICSGLFVLPT